MESNQESAVNPVNKDNYLNPMNVFPKNINDPIFDTNEKTIEESTDPKYNYVFEKEVENVDPAAHRQAIIDSMDPKYNYRFAKGFNPKNPDNLDDIIKEYEARLNEIESLVEKENIESEKIKQLLISQRQKIETLKQLTIEVEKIKKEAQQVRKLEGINEELDKLIENLNNDYFSNGIQL